eukprot:TRINITY_DN10367_c1_g1_i9.p1 TRINITY_DN10367_c1_g1~~TRINITY_DN10367_c1_g1_i9.p1  ORF type:complete len:339 (-),score=-28.19 TRINITY_DN10367_c1_g1_i9:137-1153(-)
MSQFYVICTKITTSFKKMEYFALQLKYFIIITMQSYYDNYQMLVDLPKFKSLIYSSKYYFLSLRIHMELLFFSLSKTKIEHSAKQKYLVFLQKGQEFFFPKYWLKQVLLQLQPFSCYYKVGIVAIHFFKNFFPKEKILDILFKWFFYVPQHIFYIYQLYNHFRVFLLFYMFSLVFIIIIFSLSIRAHTIMLIIIHLLHISNNFGNLYFTILQHIIYISFQFVLSQINPFELQIICYFGRVCQQQLQIFTRKFQCTLIIYLSPFFLVTPQNIDSLWTIQQNAVQLVLIFSVFLQFKCLKNCDLHLAWDQQLQIITAVSSLEYYIQGVIYRMFVFCSLYS